MNLTLKTCLVVLTTVLVTEIIGVYSETEEEAEKWLEEMEVKHSKACNKLTIASWNSATNITDETKKALEEENKIYSKFTENTQRTVLTKFPNWRSFKNKRLRKAMKLLSLSGSGNMTSERVLQIDKLISSFSSAFSTSTVCKYKDPKICNMNINDVIPIMSESSDPKELAYYFTAWHDKMSEMVPPEKYAELVAVLTEGAIARGFKSESDLLLFDYDDESENWSAEKTQQMTLGLLDDLSKIYVILHAFVRMKLRRLPEYNGLIEKCGYIPSHLTGNMWAQEWSALENKTNPYPNAPEVDSTNAMIKKGYTPLRLYQEADKMFKDLGLIGMSDEFWKNSVLEKPKDGREMNCHPQAWDFCKGKGSKDFRITQCTRVNQADFVTAHHEMGHVEYSQQYTNEQFVFRNPVNSGFGEAIGDAIALSVVTPSHLQCKLNLDMGYEKTFCDKKSGPFYVTQTDLNYLYSIALDKLAFFPFAHAVDFFRFEVFEGQIKKENYNKMWWKIRQAFQGIIPPTDRGSNPKLFDPASKFHVAAHIDYIRYFVSHILQFQFYEALCITAGEFNPNDKNSKPLYQCDFSGSKEAGRKFADMMKLGNSRGWPEALQIITGSRKISTNAFKNYLKPILDYMEADLKKNGEVIGFGDSCKAVEQRGGRSAWLDLIPANKKPEVGFQTVELKSQSGSGSGKGQKTNISRSDKMYNDINRMILDQIL